MSVSETRCWSGGPLSSRLEGQRPARSFSLPSDERPRVGNIVTASMGAAAATGLSVQLHTVDGQDLCRVHVQSSPFPVDAEVKVDKNGQLEKKTAFYVRVANGT